MPWLDPTPVPASEPSRAAPDRLHAARVLQEEAKREGFTRVGIAPALPPPRFERFRRWIAQGRHASMRYLERTLEERGDPRRLLPGARSVVCLAAPHRASSPVAPDGSTIARYAAGPDYHRTLRERAEAAARRARERLGEFRWRVCVDSAPVAERSLAAAAGLGWIGKNGCLISPEGGSFLLLAEILTDLDLPADDPMAEQCGSCVRCLEACPTGAFLEPGLLDAGRCIAYWTIEHRGPIPDEFKPSLAEHVFGCDFCQEVCPWNAPLLRDAERREGEAVPSRREWLSIGPGQWRRRWSSTPLQRAGRRGIQRNALISAGSTADVSVLALARRAATLCEAGISDAAAWAAGRLSPGR